MTLLDAKLGEKYTVLGYTTGDPDLNSFLLTLGCYDGSSIVLVSKLGTSYLVTIKDGRYNINRDLAGAIEIA